MTDFWDKLPANLGVWRRRGERAVHKPLLTLMLLARAQRGAPRQVRYSDIDQTLEKLLRDFGPPRKSYHPEYPFWYLQHDGFWQINESYLLPRRAGKDQPSRASLLRYDAVGEVPAALWKQLKSNPCRLENLARELLTEFWPETYHDEILQAVGLNVDATGAQRARRDPDFRNRVLRAYEYRCAVCGFNVRLVDVPIALEAAHIKWYQAGGPDTESNGLALCTMHHKLFDRGAFTISDNLCILVSEDAHGTMGFHEWLMQFHGKRLQRPQRNTYAPGAPFRRWHVHEVFRGTARYL